MTTKQIVATMTVDETAQRRIGTAMTAQQFADQFVIENADHAQYASDQRAAFASAIAELKALERSIIEPANKSIEAARALFRPALEALGGARVTLQNKLTVFATAEEERVRRERAEAEERERRERQRIEEQAAADRARAEQQARTERERAEQFERDRQAALDAGNTTAAATLAAQSAKSQQRAANIEQNADAKIEQRHVEVAATAPVQTEPAKIAGMTMRDNWCAELDQVSEDKAREMIVVAVAGGRRDLLAYLEIDYKALDRVAKAQKTAFAVPGFRAVNNRRAVGARK